MAELISFAGIIIGVILTLTGLLMIAPQVRIHQIEVYSRAAWIFRSGTLFTTLGLLVLLLSDGHREIGQIGFVVGISALMGGIITWNHEYAQARDAGKLPWNWKASLTLQMVIFGAMMIALSIPFI